MCLWPWNGFKNVFMGMEWCLFDVFMGMEWFKKCFYGHGMVFVRCVYGHGTLCLFDMYVFGVFMGLQQSTLARRTSSMKLIRSPHDKCDIRCNLHPRALVYGIEETGID